MENNQNLNIVGVLEVGRTPRLWEPNYIIMWGGESDTNNGHLIALVAVLGSVVPVAAYSGSVYLPVVDCPEPVTLHARARRRDVPAVLPSEIMDLSGVAQ